MTELEFLHGHLNDPGRLPAVLCFRDKEYDEKMRIIGLQNSDKKQVYKYSAESDTAIERMKDLMHRVKETEKKCLALNMSYSSPKEGAQWMFDKVWQYINEIIKERTEKRQTKREQDLLQHNSFLIKMCALYRGGETYMEKLNENLLLVNSQPLVVVGELGSGKSALLCNWIDQEIQKDARRIWIYHFVAYGSQSDDPGKNIMRRIIRSLRHEIEKVRLGAKYTEEDYSELDKQDSAQLNNECYKWMKKASELELQVVIVVDGLQKIRHESKITRPLFWLPKTIPKGICVVLSTDISDQTNLEELVTERQSQVLALEPLPANVRIDLCRDLLKLRGKTLSESQLHRVSDADQISNPLFLKVVLEELCMFGKFRELDQKIDSLASCQNISSLFGKFLERMELDYDPAYSDGNMTQKVMCALYLSRNGLTETELSQMLNIASHQWLPFYYAAEPYLNHVSGGFLKLMHEPLEKAIYDRYIQVEDRKRGFLHGQIGYYRGQYHTLKASETVIPNHMYTELLWLCYEAGDQVLLKELITTIPVFLKLFELEPYQLLEYVQSFKLTKEQQVAEFSRAVDMYAIELYTERTEEDLVFDVNIGEELVSVLKKVALFFNMARSNAEEYFLLRLKGLLESNDRIAQRDMKLHITMYGLACFYVNIREDKKALPFHLSALKFFQEKAPESEEKTEHLARSYHGTGIVYMKLSNFSEAIQSFEKSMEIHKSRSNSKESQLDVVKSLSCIAEVHALQGNYELAVQKYEEVTDMENRIYVSYRPPEMSYSLSNLGIGYRRLRLFDKAEEVYNKALKIKINAVGENHVDVAYAYFSLGNLAFDRQQPQVALQYFEKTLQTFKKVDFLDSIDAVFVRENIAQVYMTLNKKEEGLSYYWDAFNYLEKHDQMELGDGNVHLNYLRHILGSNDYTGTRRVARAMVRCEKMQHFLPYLFLDYVNRLYLSIDPTTEPYEESIEHGIECFSDNINLPYQRIELNLIPSRNLNAINETLQFYYANSKDSDAHLLVTALNLCHKAGWVEGAQGLCNFWIAKRPDFKEILENTHGEPKKEE